VRGCTHGAARVHGMSFAWPTEKVDLDEAARLITAAGKRVSRSSVSRFVKSRDFPHEISGQRKLVNAKDLFEAFTADFTRQVMAGEAGAAQTISAPTAPKVAGRDDPKYRAAQLNVIEAELNLAARLEQTVPVAEVAAAVAESIAVLSSKLAEARADAAGRLIQSLKLPEHAARTIREELKRSDREAQQAFADVWVRTMTPEGRAEAEASHIIAELVALAHKLRGETDGTSENLAAAAS
jgi:hypothetical protein